MIQWASKPGWWFFQTFFIFTPKIGEDDSQFDDHIFQRGWLKPPTRRTWLTRKITQFFPGDFTSSNRIVFFVRPLHDYLSIWPPMFLHKKCITRTGVSCFQLGSWCCLFIEPKDGKKLSYTSLAVASDTFLSRSFIHFKALLPAMNPKKN